MTKKPERIASGFSFGVTHRVTIGARTLHSELFSDAVMSRALRNNLELAVPRASRDQADQLQ
jgi:hypothetical protein